MGLAGTSGEARRLIAQGGIYVNDRPIEKFDEKITISHLNEHGEIHLRKGKKKHARYYCEIRIFFFGKEIYLDYC